MLDSGEIIKKKNNSIKNKIKNKNAYEDFKPTIHWDLANVLPN